MHSALVPSTVDGRLKDRSSTMSRTDVHRPWAIQVADPNNRHLFYRYASGEWITSFRNLSCGCRLCTGHYWRKQSNRRQRAAWRRDARVWVKGGEPRPEKNYKTW